MKENFDPTKTQEEEAMSMVDAYKAMWKNYVKFSGDQSIGG